MNISYHVFKGGRAAIRDGTPAALEPRENIVIQFDVTCTKACVYFNRKRIDAPNGIATIYADRIKPVNELLLQYTDAEYRTHTVSCEKILVKDGMAIGGDETADSFAKYKQTVVGLMATCEYLKSKNAALAAKCTELERKLNGEGALDIT